MNPYRIYRDEWAQALNEQATAKDYSSFVAMPFDERFSYRSREILCEVIGGAVQQANSRGAARRQFAAPRRVDAPRGAVVITDEIVNHIMKSHFFIGDLTFQNAGVVLEAGIALALKPNPQVILLTQGSLSDLHFDLKVNNVISYSQQGSLSDIAEALIAAAEHFESQIDQHIRKVKQRLSPEAIITLKWYGTVQQQNRHNSIHSRNRGPEFKDNDHGLQRFQLAAAELRDKDLLWTDYQSGAIEGGDAFGMHATEFGWTLIESEWPELRREASDV